MGTNPWVSAHNTRTRETVPSPVEATNLGIHLDYLAAELGAHGLGEAKQYERLELSRRKRSSRYLVPLAVIAMSTLRSA